MSTGKIVLIVVAVLLLGGVGTCGACALLVGGAAVSADRDALRAREVLREKARACRATEVREWASVVSDAKANEARLLQTWKGQCVRVAGTALKIEADYKEQPVVLVGASNDRERHYTINELRCSPAVPSRASELSAGQQVVVWGLGAEKEGGSLSLDFCDWDATPGDQVTDALDLMLVHNAAKKALEEGASAQAAAQTFAGKRIQASGTVYSDGPCERCSQFRLNDLTFGIRPDEGIDELKFLNFVQANAGKPVVLEGVVIGVQTWPFEKTSPVVLKITRIAPAEPAAK